MWISKQIVAASLNTYRCPLKDEVDELKRLFFCYIITRDPNFLAAPSIYLVFL